MKEIPLVCEVGLVIIDIQYHACIIDEAKHHHSEAPPVPEIRRCIMPTGACCRHLPHPSVKNGVRRYAPYSSTLITAYIPWGG